MTQFRGQKNFGIDFNARCKIQYLQVRIFNPRFMDTREKLKFHAGFVNF